VEELSFFIREIKSSDEFGLFQLRNDPDIYKWFLSDSPVRDMDHRSWMETRLKSFKRVTLVADTGDSVIGTAYLSGIVNGNAEIAIRVEVASSGHGVGKLLLQNLIEQAKELELLRLYAKVHTNNFDSIRFFENSGFEITSEIVDLTHNVYGLEFLTFTLELRDR
jgi:RimJ/RimL family protein N-acetyltransferase